MNDAMNINDHAAFEEYVQRASTHQSASLAPVVTLIAFTIFACLAWPILSDAATANGSGLRKPLHALLEMASSVSLGLLRRPLPSMAHESGALNSVFGLKSSAAGSALKSLGADTLQRGIGGIRSMVKGGTNSDVPAGLGNWDNSCYQNSVIQGLASLRSLPDFLARVAARSPRGEGGHMNEALLGMVQKLNDGGNNGELLWLPAELKTMSTWQQQDAQEYFSKVLEKVDKEALKVAKQDPSTRNGSLSLDEARDHLTLKEEAEAKEAENLHNPLEGMIAQRVGCKACGHSDGISLIPFNCLTVPLGHDNLYDIRDCLDEYTALEDIDGVQCPKCTLLAFRIKLQAIITNKSSEALRQHVEHRLRSVTEALDNQDFSDNAITKKCQIPKKQWIESTKTKQAVVARAPRGLVIHVNRSMFNEYTGVQIKNPAAVRFPISFGLGSWMLGSMSASPSSSPSSSYSQEKDAATEAEGEEHWSMDPQKSMLPEPEPEINGEDQSRLAASNPQYKLRAVITHFGRHENGHYVCYRKHPYIANKYHMNEEDANEGIEGEDALQQKRDAWWRLSDDDVTQVGEDFVLRQGGVFMLFYERADDVIVESKTAAPAPVQESMAADVAAEDAARIPLPAGDDEDLDSVLVNEDTLPPGPHTPLTEDPSFPEAHLPSEEEKPTSSSHLLPTPPQSPTSISESDLDSIADDVPVASGFNAPAPAQAIKMRTANVFADDRSRGSNESLLMGSRMVSAS